MGGADALRTVQVGDGARYAQNAVIAPGGEAQGGKSVVHERLALVGEGAPALHILGTHLRIALGGVVIASALELAGGYDHNYIPDRPDCARAWSDDTGITLCLTTDRPGVQLYTGNFLGSTPPGKGGARYPQFGGFCLETQAFPDAPHHTAFPSAVLRAGERFESTTSCTFGIIGKEFGS